LKASPPPPNHIVFTAYPPPSPPNAIPVSASLEIFQNQQPTIKEEKPSFTVINIQPASTSVRFPIGTLTKLEPTMNVIAKTENRLAQRIKTEPVISEVIHHQHITQISTSKVDPIHGVHQNLAKKPQNFPIQTRQFIPIIQNVKATNEALFDKLSKKKRKTMKKLKRFKASLKDLATNHKPRKYTKRSPRINSDDNSEGTSIEKRSIHNNMERKRRIDMKNLFFELKHAIPTLEPQERVAKVNILRAAISYCNQIQREEKLLMELRRKNKRLMMRINKLGASSISKASSIGSFSSSVTSSASSSFESCEEY
jgi:Max protein